MKIAQVAPLWESVPPKAYGGIELVVAALTDELIARGHEVTLFASGDSETSAQLESVIAQSLRQDPEMAEGGTYYHNVYYNMQLARVQELASEFDVIHCHTWIPPFQLTELVKTPTVYTLHGSFTKLNRQLYQQYRQHNYISISDAQQQLGPNLNYLRTVYNGIDLASHPFQEQPAAENYLAFLGRFSRQKGPHLAIQVAQQTGLPLKMAGKIDECDLNYFETEVAPHIDGQQIQFLSEANHAEKIELLGNALATLFPITWDEPFGLVMIESMAVGTPVIALNRGSVAEVVQDGRTGFVCQHVDHMADAVTRLGEIDRYHCRQVVESHFSFNRMVDGYETTYRQLVRGTIKANGRVRGPVLLGTGSKAS